MYFTSYYYKFSPHQIQQWIQVYLVKFFDLSFSHHGSFLRNAEGSP